MILSRISFKSFIKSHIRDKIAMLYLSLITFWWACYRLCNIRFPFYYLLATIDLKNANLFWRGNSSYLSPFKRAGRKPCRAGIIIDFLIKGKGFLGI